MKRLLAVLMMVVMLAGIVPIAEARRSANARLPEVGDKVCGFTLTEKRDFALVGAEALHFVHDTTGAELLYIANSDTNRLFDLTFFTAAADNTGVAHVLEHAVLKGSEKYPSSSLFFNLLYQTYNTYMNAETGASYTTYPAASLSEKQLLAYADFYTDSCLHPMVLQDESIFRDEAWRYRLEEEDGPLTIEGTVYSEMQAATSLFQTAYYNMLRTAFPGSVYGNISGGAPENIPELTWQDLKEYHAQYYHPPNCTAYLYGKFEDYTAFLKLLDEAFAGYDRRERGFRDDGWEPIQGEVSARFAYPVEQGSDTDHVAGMYYVFLCPGLKENQEEELLLNTLTDLMAVDSSPVMQKLNEALPSAFLSTWISMGTPVDAIVFCISGVIEEDAETARAAIDEGLNEIAHVGFSQELVDSISASLDMTMRLSRENTALGLNLVVSQMIPYYAESGRIFDCLDYAEALRKMDEWNQQGLYQKAVSERLIHCGTRAVTITVPEPGLREELDAAETARLAEVRAQMNREELDAILSRTAGEEAEEETENTADELVRQLQVVTVQSLPEEQRQTEILDETDALGVRRLEAEAEVDGVGMPVILLNAGGIPQEDLHWFVLYLSLLGQMDTESHSQEELQGLISRYLYGAEFRQSLMDEYGTKEFHPYLRAGWISSAEDLETGYGLLYELLFETDFGDTEALPGLIERNLVGMKSVIQYSAYNTMMYRELGADSPLYAYYSHCNGVDYYEFLKSTRELVQSDPEAVSRKLKEIQQSFHNREGALAIFAGDADMMDTNRSCSEAFFKGLEATPVEDVRYEFEAPAMREALVVDETVQYNGLVGSFDVMGLDGYTADLDAVAALISDQLLIPRLRDEYGVYTPMHYYDSFAGTYLISYRDPNIEETFRVYEELPELLATAEVSQETLDGYILSCYSGYAMQEGELSGAVAALISYLSGEPEDLKLQQMRELKSLTPEKLKEYAAGYEKLAENGHRFTVGSESVISVHEDLYDQILRPFRGEEDA